MKSFILMAAISMCAYYTTIGQNLSGIWQGKLTQNTSTFDFELELIKIDSINYNCISRIKVGKDSGVMNAECKIVNGVLFFEETVIIEDNSANNEWCLKTGKLSYKESNNKPKLYGTWSGDCAPGTMELFKVQQLSFSPTAFNFDSLSLILTSKKVDAVFSYLHTDTAPGAIIAVVKNEKVIFKKAYGMANLEHNIPIDASTVFKLGGVTMQFTGFAISLLIEQGKIALDDDIRKYIPEFPDFKHTVTIGHLVHHTSGLRDWFGAFALKGRTNYDPITFQEILAMTYNQKALNFPPGSKYLFSATNYDILAELVQRVSGESLREWTDTNLFHPLNMVSSHFYGDHTEVIKNKANGYFYKERNHHVGTDNVTAMGSISLYASIDDLIKWAINMQKPKVGSESIINRMIQNVGVVNGKKTTYGFGLVSDKYQGINRVFHDGRSTSYNTNSIYFPDENLSIIMLSNMASFDPRIMGSKVADIYLKDKLVSEKQKKAEEEPLATFKRNELTGNYYSTWLGRIIGISEKNDSLRVNITWNNSSFNVINTKGNTFEIPNSPSLKFTFSELKEDKAQTLMIFQGKNTKWQRIQTIDSSNVNLADYTGEFYSEELLTTYTFSIVDGKLIATHERSGDIALMQKNKDLFLITEETLLAWEIEFIRDSKNTVTGVGLSNVRARNLYFKKVN
jgi:CubicO group peptidase (beta-lactamase class C family)|tara:strand:+ start:3888 stop:5930 length:2043 start_codon:yes stop_codon:yes gene_type:complete